MVKRLFIVQNMFGETVERAVKGLFYIIREGAGGQLVEPEVIGDALAAPALSGAGFVGAVTFGFVCVYIAFHKTITSMYIAS